MAASPYFLPVSACAAMGAALYSFLRGFAEYRFRSRLAGMAFLSGPRVEAGPVSVAGPVRPVFPLLDPVYNRPCVYYSVDVFEASAAAPRAGAAARLFNRDVRTFTGRKIALYHSDSGCVPFLISDQAAGVPVYPDGLSWLGGPTLEIFEKNPGDSALAGDEAAARFLSGIRRRRGVHLRAVIIREGEELRLWGEGTAEAGGRIRPEEEQAAARLQEREYLERLLRADAAARGLADRDRDGELKGGELVAAVEAKRAELADLLYSWRARLDAERRPVLRFGRTGLYAAPTAQGGPGPVGGRLALRLFGAPALFLAALALLLTGLPGPTPPAGSTVVPISASVPGLPVRPPLPAEADLARTAAIGGKPPPAEADRMQVTGLETDEMVSQKACDAGDMRECFLLGAQYLDGRGVGKDEAKAAGLLDKACGGKEFSACTLYAFMQLTGRGLAKDPSAAAAKFSGACKAGDAYACGMLGALHTDGLGVARDLSAAAGYYGKACDGGLARGCISLGQLRLNGQGGPRDLEAAQQLAAKACGLRDQAGCQLLRSVMVAIAQDAAQKAQK